MAGIDVADLFIESYDSLVSTPRHVLVDWASQRAALRARDELPRRLHEDATLPQEWIQDMRMSGDSASLGMLMGLDDAFGLATPFGGSHNTARMTRAAARYARFARFNEDESKGWLLPRCTYPARPTVIPDRLADFFRHVIRVTPDQGRDVSYRKLEDRYDVAGDELLNWIRVGCIPFIELFSDFNLVALADPRRFQAAPRANSSVLSRPAEVLSELDRSGALIGVLPESTLNRELLEEWQRLMRHHRKPPGSDLKWLLIGTGPTDVNSPPCNRAVVLDRVSGRVVFDQFKNRAFTFDEAQISAWGLDQVLGNRSITEDLRCGQSLSIVSSRLGRFAILICEDLGRASDFINKIRDFGVSHVITPIFSKPIDHYRWEQQASELLCREVGTAVVVVNSLVVARMQKVKGPVRTALVVTPSDDDRLGWDTSVRHGFSEQATDTSVLVLNVGISPRPAALAYTRNSPQPEPLDRRSGQERRGTVERRKVLDLTRVEPSTERRIGSDRRSGTERRSGSSAR